MTDESRSNGSWPPSFTLDQERILNLLTGDRFYSNRSAALREAVLNAIDAVNRRKRSDSTLEVSIEVIFDREAMTLTVGDNGIGMGRADVSSLFAKIGASAARTEVGGTSVGEFGIGIVSYFMAGDRFVLQTYDGRTEPLGLSFAKAMLADGTATPIEPTRASQGTTVTLELDSTDTFALLLEKFPFWCRDVEGLTAILRPEERVLSQGETHKDNVVPVPSAAWVERSHLGPVDNPSAWDAMTGTSTVAILYRGVFVQEFEVRGLWGIEGSIDVDPKHFKPRLNREGFVEGQFQSEVQEYLGYCHPSILEAMARRLASAVNDGTLDKWDEKRWATLWLSVPRDSKYAGAVATWDAVFRSLPAFELAAHDKWQAVSLEQLIQLDGDVYVAPLADQKQNDDVVNAALRFLRNTGQPVIRGIRRDRSWLRFAPNSFATTADLISRVFGSELPKLVSLVSHAARILEDIDPIAGLFTGPPPVDLVRLGTNSPPALKLGDRLIINTDTEAGKAMVLDVLKENRGATSLIAISARHAYKQLSQIASVVRDSGQDPEILSPIRRRYIRDLLA